MRCVPCGLMFLSEQFTVVTVCSLFLTPPCVCARRLSTFRLISGVPCFFISPRCCGFMTLWANIPYQYCVFCVCSWCEGLYLAAAAAAFQSTELLLPCILSCAAMFTVVSRQSAANMCFCILWFTNSARMPNACLRHLG